jgi:RNase P/RNase MRP subunit POP5
LTQTELIQAIRQHTNNLFSKDTKELGLWVVQFDGTSGIIKCKNQEKEHTRELLESLKMVNSKPVSITTHATSGTIRALTNKR